MIVNRMVSKSKNNMYLCCILAFFLLSSCSLKKGYEALDVYNYFKAKKKFEQLLSRKPSPAAYGLGLIYFRDDNPFHNMDSAYHYTLMAVETFKNSKTNKKAKWNEKLNYNLNQAKSLRNKLSNYGFKIAQQQNTVENYDYFLSKYPWSDYVKNATRNRDSLAFIEAKNTNLSTAYQLYMERYPKSNWYNEAQDKFFRSQYKENTLQGKTETYLSFMEKYPDNPFVRDAEYQVYSIETEENTIESYKHFLANFPSNPFVNTAWKRLYRLSISDYNKSSIQSFAKHYPNFPFPKLIKQDLKLSGEQLFRIFNNEKFGFMNRKGEVVIAPNFSLVHPFHNGLALVAKDEKYGYINKNGKVIIPYQFDDAFNFKKGRAIVSKAGKYGIIDVTGNYILPLKYNEIGDFSEGLMYVEDSLGYKYYTLDGTVAFAGIYNNAFSFYSGIARVEKEGKKGYINKHGEAIVFIENGNIRPFGDSLFIHERIEKSVLINPYSDKMDTISFDRIGVLSSNRAIVVKSGKYGYIDRSGKLVIPIQYNPFSNFMEFAKFHNHYAVYQKGDKLAMMDSLGENIYPGIFTGIGVYGELIPVSKGKGWGYADSNVQLKIDYQYDYAHPFIDGTAIVEKEDKFGLINLKNDEIIPIKYTSIERIGEQLFIVQQEGKFGVISKSGNLILPIQYDRIKNDLKNRLLLIRDNTISYYLIAERQLIKLK